MNRRAFLTSVAAGTITLSNSSFWPSFVAAQAAAVDGVPRGLFSQTFAPLSGALLGPGEWKPYPKAGDAKWSTVPQAVRDALIASADKANASPWPEMLATDELEFKRNGNRTRFETISFGRRSRLGDLVLGECIANQGKYLDQIANGIWLICEESFWGVPAHLGVQKAGVGLADVAEPIIELFGAETSATMGWIVYLLEKQLNSVSPRLVERIHLEAKRRILDPYFTRSDFSWMGLNGKPHKLNNWNPWINSNVLTANLLLEKDAQRRQAMVAKIARSVDEFLADYSPDAGCEEGPGYWARSAASFFDCCSTLVSAHAGQGDAVLKHPFTRAMGHYICNVHIAGNYFVNYGDAHPHDAPNPDLSYRFGRATGDTMLAEFGAFDSKTHGTLAKGGALSSAISDRSGVASLSRMLARVLVAEEIASSPAQDALPRDAWYPHLGLMTARETEGSAAGFYLAAQAASNGRSHSHNDSGSFIVFHNGEPVFIDVGPEAYTAKTFSKDRYTLWTMQSAYHNLPTIGGVMQHDGMQFRASELKYENSDAAVMFRANLTTAYPKEANIRRWIRTLTLDRAKSIVTISEDFDLGKPVDVTLSLMTAVAPVVQADGVKIGGTLLMFDQAALKAEVEKIPITDETLKHSWGEAVYRIKLNSAAPVAKAAWRLELRTV
jgi:Heparinase II/III-like protein